MKNKYLFLDFDGVLNSNKIIEHYRCWVYLHEMNMALSLIPNV